MISMTTIFTDGRTKPDFSRYMLAMVRTVLDRDGAVALLSLIVLFNMLLA